MNNMNNTRASTNIGFEKAREAAQEFGLPFTHPVSKSNPNQNIDFDDLRQSSGIEEVTKQLSNNMTNSNELMEWENPILFDDIGELPEIPADILPSPLKEFTKALANSTETPEGMTVMAILSVLATTLQGKFEVRPHTDETSHKQSVNLYTITAMPPANRKSSVSSSCINPLLEWEKEQREILEPEIKKQKSRYESEKKLIDDMRKKLKSSAEDGGFKLIEEIASRESDLKEPGNLPQLVVNDVTPESLANIIAEQNNRMSIFSDEGGIVDTMAGLYSGGNSNIDILLKGWDCGSVRQKRKDRDLNISPLLTINLTVQPVIIQNMGGKKAYSGKGLLERFLYCLPKSRLGYRTHDKPPVPIKLKNDYRETIWKLLRIPYSEDPIMLSLDREAAKEWHDFQNIIEVELRSDGRLSSCQGWGGKICGHALRIAALLHVAEYENKTTTIDIKTLEKALELCSILTFHAMAVFSTMEIDPDIRDAKEILRWICDNRLSCFIKADVTKKMQNRTGMNADRLDKLLNILFQRNIISAPTKKGKKTFQYIVNPMIGDAK